MRALPRAGRRDPDCDAETWATVMLMVARARPRLRRRWRARAERARRVWLRQHRGHHTRWMFEAITDALVARMEFRDGLGMLPEQWARIDRGEEL